jgi:hypothetical protein
MRIYDGSLLTLTCLPFADDLTADNSVGEVAVAEVDIGQKIIG